MLSSRFTAFVMPTIHTSVSGSDRIGGSDSNRLPRRIRAAPAATCPTNFTCGRREMRSSTRPSRNRAAAGSRSGAHALGVPHSSQVAAVPPNRAMPPMRAVGRWCHRSWRGLAIQEKRRAIAITSGVRHAVRRKAIRKGFMVTPRAGRPACSHSGMMAGRSASFSSAPLRDARKQRQASGPARRSAPPGRRGGSLPPYALS